MPPKRRERNAAEEHAAFENVLELGIANFARPRTLAIRVPLSVEPRQIERTALLAIISRKLLFHPVDPATVVATPAANRSKKGNESSSSSAAAAPGARGGSDDDDDDDTTGGLSLVRSLSGKSSQQQQSSASQQQQNLQHSSSQRQQQQQEQREGTRIICGIHNDVQDIQVAAAPAASSTKAASEQRISVTVTVLADTVEVLSDGMCSAKILTVFSNKKNGDKDENIEDSYGLQLSIRCANTEHFLGLSNPQKRVAKKKKKKQQKKQKGSDSDDDSDAVEQHQDDDAEEEDDEEDDGDAELFRAVVPVDVPKLADAAHTSDAAKKTLSGKFALLSVEDGGRTWRAHAGITPSLAAKDRKSWFVVLPGSYTAGGDGSALGGDDDDAGGHDDDGGAQQKAKNKKGGGTWKGQGGMDLRNPRATKSSNASRIVVAYKSEPHHSSSHH